MFTASWSNAKIMHAISDVTVNNPWVQTTGKPGAMFTKVGDPVRFEVIGKFEGKTIKVITTHTDIITAYPFKKHMKSVKLLLNQLIHGGELVGLPDQDINIAREYLENRELELCFDTIVTQLYEYDLEIERDYYNLIVQIGSKLKLPEKNYLFTKELIRNSNTIPQTVKNKLSEIINRLNQKS